MAIAQDGQGRTVRVQQSGWIYLARCSLEAPSRRKPMKTVTRYLPRIALAAGALLALGGCVYGPPRTGVVYDDEVGPYYDSYYASPAYSPGYYYGPAYYGSYYDPWYSGWPIGFGLGLSYYGGGHHYSGHHWSGGHHSGGHYSGGHHSGGGGGHHHGH
jgi:hypothetical protein